MSALGMVSMTARGAAISFTLLALMGSASAARAQSAQMVAHNMQAHGGVPWDAPDRAAHRPNPVLATDAAIERGRMIFQQACRLCHGEKGRGDGPMSTSLPLKPADLSSEHVQSQTDGALFWKIYTGRGNMPSTQATLSDDLRWSVVDYIRTLAVKR